MSVVVIPFGYEELPTTDRDSIVPICLPTIDDEGRRIAWGWFEAVEQIQAPLRSLSRSVLGDVWRVSEVTELAVKSVWRKHGSNLGISASGRVYSQARWYAQDLKAGSARHRRGLNIALDELDALLQGQLLVDPCDYHSQYGQQMDLAALGQRLRQNGLEEIDQMLQLVRDGCTWDEIGSRLSRDPSVARRRFWRWMKRAAKLLSLDQS